MCGDPAQEILDTITIESIFKRRVILPPDLSNLTHPEKYSLILALAAELAAAQGRIATQDARIAALEARLDALSRPAKAPDNSSSRPRKARSRIARQLSARHARAVPASDGRCIRTPIAWSMPG